MNPGDAPRRPAAPTGAPGHPQPPARGPRGTPGFVAWFPVNRAPCAAIVNFSTLRPPAKATARGPRPKEQLEPLDHLSPLPYSPISILLKLTFRPPGPRTPGWLIAPHAAPLPGSADGLACGHCRRPRKRPRELTAKNCCRCVKVGLRFFLLN